MSNESDQLFEAVVADKTDATNKTPSGRVAKGGLLRGSRCGGGGEGAFVN